MSEPIVLKRFVKQVLFERQHEEIVLGKFINTF